MDQELLDAIEQHQSEFDEFNLNIATLPLAEPGFRNRLLQQIKDCIALDEPIRAELVGMDSAVLSGVDI